MGELEVLQTILYVTAPMVGLFPFLLFSVVLARKEVMLRVKHFFNRNLILVRHVRPDHRIVTTVEEFKDGRLVIDEQEKIVNPSDIVINTGLSEKVVRKIKTGKQIYGKKFGIIPAIVDEVRREVRVKNISLSGGMAEVTFINENTYNHDYFVDVEKSKYLHGKQLKNLLLLAESTTPDLLNMIVKYKHIFLLLVGLCIGVGASTIFGFQSFDILSNGVKCLP